MVTTDVITVFDRKRAKTTLAWREMKSQRCWKTPFHRKSKCVCVYVCVWQIVLFIIVCVCSEQTAAVGAYWLPTLPTSLAKPYICHKVISLFLLWQHSRSTVMQQQFNKVGKVETGSVALPAIMRSGAGGPESFQMGSMPQAKQHITSGQMHRGHMPPLVKQ